MSRAALEGGVLINVKKHDRRDVSNQIDRWDGGRVQPCKDQITWMIKLDKS
jgi:hypothetical protein